MIHTVPARMTLASSNTITIIIGARANHASANCRLRFYATLVVMTKSTLKMLRIRPFWRAAPSYYRMTGTIVSSHRIAKS